MALRAGTFIAILVGSGMVAAGADKTVLVGVYTTAQARRGQTVYESKCAECHRADLGGFSGPPLKGDLFMDRWREFKLQILYDLVKSTMPADNPGSLGEAAYLDVQAYLLQANDIPPGMKELRPDMVADALLVGKDGPKPLPSSAQVEVVGCLTLDSGNGWFLTKAAEPVRTLDPYEISAGEATEARAKPLGDQLFRLANIMEIPKFDPDSWPGNKVAAKGILVRPPNNERINLNALEVVSPGCEK